MVASHPLSLSPLKGRTMFIQLVVVVLVFVAASILALTIMGVSLAVFERVMKRTATEVEEQRT